MSTVLVGAGGIFFLELAKALATTWAARCFGGG